MSEDQDAKHWVQEKWFGVSISIIGVLILAVVGMSYSQLVKVDDKLAIVSNTMVELTKEFTKQLNDMRYNQLTGAMTTVRELEALKSADMLFEKEIKDIKEDVEQLKEQKK